MARKTYKDYDYHYSILGLSSLAPADEDWPSGNPNRRYKLFSFSNKKQAKALKTKLERAGAERALLTKNKEGFLVSWARSKRSEMGKTEYRFQRRVAVMLSTPLGEKRGSKRA